MPEMVDLTPAAQSLKDVLARIDDAQLSDPTPCEESTVAALLDHVGGLAVAFAAAARKDLGDLTSAAPTPSAANLRPGWRSAIPPRLDALAEAWTEPAAWEGMTQVGGIDLPGGVAGTVALNELVLHGWDLARATGQPYDLDEGCLRAALDSLHAMYPPGADERREGIFGPEVPVPADAPLLDRVVGYSGRDPSWRR